MKQKKLYAITRCDAVHLTRDQLEEVRRRYPDYKLIEIKNNYPYPMYDNERPYYMEGLCEHTNTAVRAYNHVRRGRLVFGGQESGRYKIMPAGQWTADDTAGITTYIVYMVTK